MRRRCAGDASTSGLMVKCRCRPRRRARRGCQLSDTCVLTHGREQLAGLDQVGRVEPLAKARVGAAQRREIGPRRASDRHRRAQLERERLLRARHLERARESCSPSPLARSRRNRSSPARGGRPRAARSLRADSRAAPIAGRRDAAGEIAARASAWASWRCARPEPSVMPSARRSSRSACVSASAARTRPLRRATSPRIPSADASKIPKPNRSARARFASASSSARSSSPHHR